MFLGKECSRCGATVPAATKVGDRCPHCHARFGGERDVHLPSASSGLGDTLRDWLGRSLDQNWFKWLTAPLWLPLALVCFILFAPVIAIKKLVGRE